MDLGGGGFLTFLVAGATSGGSLGWHKIQVGVGGGGGAGLEVLGRFPSASVVQLVVLGVLLFAAATP